MEELSGAFATGTGAFMAADVVMTANDMTENPTIVSE